ncbi:MAG: hypothetical protein JNL94_04185 [Planctomycetes bacterium]|nr:hypothetical protein [Planctomycetota bacterium]
MSSPRLLAFALSVTCAAWSHAQTPPVPVAPPTPDDTKAVAEEGGPMLKAEKGKAAKYPIVETVEPVAGNDATAAAAVVQKALAYMGGEKLAAARTIEFHRLSLHWGNRRHVFTERYQTQARLAWPPVARVTEFAFDTVKRKARPEMTFVQNGADAFMQSGLEVYSYPANEVAAKTRVATELGVPLLLSWLVKAQAPMKLDGRVTVSTFKPKTFLEIQRDDKKDEGYADYEPATATYLQVTAEVPADLVAHFGSTVVLYFDETDGRLARWRLFPLSRSVDRFGNLEAAFEIEAYVDAVDTDGKPTGVRVPGLVFGMLAGSAERVETLELKQVVLNRDLGDELFRRP